MEIENNKYFCDKTFLLFLFHSTNNWTDIISPPPFESSSLPLPLWTLVIWFLGIKKKYRKICVFSTFLLTSDNEKKAEMSKLLLLRKVLCQLYFDNYASFAWSFSRNFLSYIFLLFVPKISFFLYLISIPILRVEKTFSLRLFLKAIAIHWENE